MTFEEAVSDPNRPLSLTPSEWMYSVEASLAEEEEIVEKTARRIAKTEGIPEPDSGIEKLDLGIDQMVQGVRLALAGIRDTRLSDLNPPTRRAVENIRDLIETAIAPYLADIINHSDAIDSTNEK